MNEVQLTDYLGKTVTEIRNAVWEHVQETSKHKENVTPVDMLRAFHLYMQLVESICHDINLVILELAKSGNIGIRHRLVSVGVSSDKRD